MTETQHRSAETRQPGTRTLKVGIVGIGVGATEIIPAIADMPELELVAGADVDPVVLERFGEHFP